MFKPKPGYSVVGDTEVKESVSLSLHGAGSYKIMWNVAGKDPQEVGAFEYAGEGDQDITITYDGEGVSVTNFGSLKPVTKEDAVATVPVALTAAQIRQQELAANRAKGGAVARVAVEAALKKAQEDQAREEAEAQQRELESQLERQKAAEKERAAQLKAEEERAAAEEQARKDQAAEEARVNNAATKIQSKVRQRATTKQVEGMREEKAHQEALAEEKRKEDERVAAEAEATRIAELKAHAEKEKAEAEANARAAAEASSVTMGAGVGAGAGSGSSHGAYVAPFLLLEFDDYTLMMDLVENKKVSGDVSFKTVSGETKTLPLNESTVFLNDIDRKQPIRVTIEGYGSQSITVSANASELKVSPNGNALNLRGM